MDRSILAAVWQARKTAVVIAAMAAMLALFAGPALAALITGTPGNDTLVGTNKSDVILGQGGNDTLRGANQSDDLRGGPGNDTIYGELGADVLRGQAGDDNLYGGPDSTQGPQQNVDEYFCGGGFDVVHLEKSEHSAHDIAPACEEVVKE
jgi:Ca2+-binding RTX toxin-like protein